MYIVCLHADLVDENASASAPKLESANFLVPPSYGNEAVNIISSFYLACFVLFSLNFHSGEIKVLQKRCDKILKSVGVKIVT